jgi:hypothetical protein
MPGVVDRLAAAKNPRAPAPGTSSPMQKGVGHSPDVQFRLPRGVRPGWRRNCDSCCAGAIVAIGGSVLIPRAGRTPTHHLRLRLLRRELKERHGSGDDRRTAIGLATLLSSSGSRGMLRFPWRSSGTAEVVIDDPPMSAGASRDRCKSRLAMSGVSPTCVGNVRFSEDGKRGFKLGRFAGWRAPPTRRPS